MRRSFLLLLCRLVVSWTIGLGEYTEDLQSPKASTQNPRNAVHFPTSNLAPSPNISVEPSAFPVQSVIPSRTPSESLKYPTSFPSSRPTLTPICHPTSEPTSLPVSFPTSVPSLSPSQAPSALPTPGGQAGTDWWYIVTANGWLFGQTAPTAKEKLKIVETSAETAFTLMLTDQLSATEATLLHVSVTINTGRNLRVSQGSSVDDRRIHHKNILTESIGEVDSGDVPADPGVDNTVFMRVDINAWCTRSHLAKKVCQRCIFVKLKEILI